MFDRRWIIEDNFGRRWRLWIAEAGEGGGLRADGARIAIDDLIYFSLRGTPDPYRRNAETLFEIHNALTGHSLSHREWLQSDLMSARYLSSQVEEVLEQASSNRWLLVEEAPQPNFFQVPKDEPAPEPPPPPFAQDKTTFVAIRLIDQDGNAVPRRRFELTTSDDRPRDGALDAEGSRRIGDLNPFDPTCNVVFPEFDERDFAKPVALPGTRSVLETGPVKNPDAPKIHVVRRGDTTASIARSHGFENFETLWNAPGNRPLRARRDNPQSLLEGDEVALIEAKPKTLTASKGTETTFTVFLAKLRLRLRAFDRNQKPRASQSFVVVVDGEELDKTTDGDGFLEVPLLRASSRVTVRFGGDEDGEEDVLDLGSLEPNTEVEGLDERLRNLNFRAELPLSDVELEGDVDLAQEDFELSLQLFQDHKGLNPDAQPTADTVDGIAEDCGS